MSSKGQQKVKLAYQTAKDKKVGETAICPSCGTEFVKSNYQQAFCKSKGGTICKDKYWNRVTPTKRNNTTRISPASARYMATRIDLNAPNIVGGSGRISGYTSEGYRIMDGVAYDEFDEPMYNVDMDDDRHPFDLEP
jgi:hypothetical protein